MIRPRAKIVAATAAALLLLGLEPVAAYAYTAVTYWEGYIGPYDTRTSNTSRLIAGSRYGGAVGMQIEAYAQTVTPYSIYASAVGYGTAAEVWHSPVGVQARCFQRPLYGEAAPGTSYAVCNYYY